MGRVGQRGGYIGGPFQRGFVTDRLVLVGYRCVECAVVLHEGNAMLKPVRRTGSDGEIIEEQRACCIRCLTGEKPQ